jgi:hypothetical protein
MSWDMTQFRLVRGISVSIGRAPISEIKARYSLFQRNVANIVPEYTAPDPEACCLNIRRTEHLGAKSLRKIPENKLRTHVSFTEVFDAIFHFVLLTNGRK